MLQFNWGVFWAILAALATRQLWILGWSIFLTGKLNTETSDRLYEITELLRDIRDGNRKT